jgi:hypothetical protein
MDVESHGLVGQGKLPATARYEIRKIALERVGYAVRLRHDVVLKRGVGNSE